MVITTNRSDAPEAMAQGRVAIRLFHANPVIDGFPVNTVFTFPGIELSFFYRMTGASGDIRATTSKLKQVIDSACDDIRNVDQI